MANKKIEQYNMDKIDAIGANFNLIWGERSNGKSYQVKHKKGVEKYIKEGRRFILMRRWKEEITTEKIEQYFHDIDVSKLTNGKYNCISVYRKTLYLATYDNDKGKTTRGDKIGYVVALSTEQNYAGASYLDVDDIIFEEFMARGVYIAGEAEKLMNFYCTVDRKRGTTRLWLVGNTISRACPYIIEWDLLRDVSKQKQGTIIEKELQSTEDTTVKLAIEYCKATGVSSNVIGKHADMLNAGSWQSDPQPHLPKSYKEYKVLYRIVFAFKSFKFIGEYLMDKNDKSLVWFIYPKDTDIKTNTVVISDIVNQSHLWGRDLRSFQRLPRIQKILDTIQESNTFYATDSCGTDFKQVIDFIMRK